MKEKIEKLMNSTCKEDILVAFQLVKHTTRIRTPTVIMWWIQRNCEQPWSFSCYGKSLRLMHFPIYAQTQIVITIEYSELD